MAAGGLVFKFPREYRKLETSPPCGGTGLCVCVCVCGHARVSGAVRPCAVASPTDAPSGLLYPQSLFLSLSEIYCTAKVTLFSARTVFKEMLDALKL